LEINRLFRGAKTIAHDKRLARYEDANVGFRFTNRTSTVEPSGPELKAFEQTFLAGAKCYPKNAPHN